MAVVYYIGLGFRACDGGGVINLPSHTHTTIFANSGKAAPLKPPTPKPYVSKSQTLNISLAQSLKP